MNKQAILKEVREIAALMAIRGVIPGEITEDVRHRVLYLMVEAGVPFKPWRQGIQHKGGKRFHDEAGMLCRAITERLMLAQWQTLRDVEVDGRFSGWTPEIAEAAIVKAAAELPSLCNQLDALDSKPDELEGWSGPMTKAEARRLLAVSERTMSRMVAESKAGSDSAVVMEVDMRKVRIRVSELPANH